MPVDDMLPQHDLDAMKLGKVRRTASPRGIEITEKGYAELAKGTKCNQIAYQRQMEAKERERDAYADGCKAGWELAWDRAASALKAYVGR